MGVKQGGRPSAGIAATVLITTALAATIGQAQTPPPPSVTPAAEPRLDYGNVAAMPSMIDAAQARPRGEKTVHLLSDDKQDRLTRDLQTLIHDAVEVRRLTDSSARPDAPTMTSDQVGRLTWWEPANRAGGLALNDLLARSAANSLQIASFSELPAIRATSIAEANGRFTPEAFAEGRYNERDEPTTALYQTRGSGRLEEQDTDLEAGVRARLRTGAEVSLSQRLSNVDTNLIDYSPQEQSRSRTVLSVVQPLLREGGTGYNNAVTKIARLETESAESEFRRQAEAHLMEVVRTYWTLGLGRAVLAQQQRALQSVDTIVGRIRNRSGLDTQELQLSRARAVAADRRASLVRAESAVRNAESRLRALVNAPDLPANLAIADLPRVTFAPIGGKTLAEQALASRPEVMQGVLGYRAALLREGMAANEALPRLDLIAEGSTNGRDGNFRFNQAFGNAYNNDPSWLVGLRFSVPLGKDERKARFDRRRIETNQQALQLRSAVETVILDTEVAANEYQVAWSEMMRRAEALQLAGADQDVLGQRYLNGTGASNPGDGILFLDRLLDSQTRVAGVERELAEAEATFQVASVAVSRARGTLLSDLGFAVQQTGVKDGLPRYALVRATPANTSVTQ